MAASARLLWPDLMRALAISLVVVIHVSGSVLNAGYNASGHYSWWFSAVANCMARFGVPLFFMSSGALVLGKAKTETAGAFLMKRMSRIIVPFLAWSLVYLALQAFRGQVHLSIPTVMNIAREPVYYHLWFFYSIIGLYLFAPLLKSATADTLRYLVIFWIITAPMMFVASRVFQFSLNGNFQSIVPTYIGYFVGGYLLKDVILKKNMILMCGAVFAVCGAITIAGFALLTFRNGGMQDGFFLDYLNVNIVAGSAALFCLVRALSEKIPESGIKKSVQIISACSLGIFAVHPMILELLASGNLGFKVSAEHGPVVIAALLTFVIVMTVSTAITALISKIPVLNRIV
jgi:surface polysaccharide O-acyltransferase-like enzyme